MYYLLTQNTAQSVKTRQSWWKKEEQLAWISPHSVFSSLKGHRLKSMKLAMFKEYVKADTL